MDVRLHQDPDEFKALAVPFCSADPLQHTVALTVMARFIGHRTDIDPLMVTLHSEDHDTDTDTDHSSLVGVALRTPPWPVIASGLPTDPALLDTFIAAWLDHDPDVPGVNGPRAHAEAVADAWIRHTGGTIRETTAGRLFRLGELTPPTTKGHVRQATEHDIPLLAQWREAFQIEAIGYLRDPNGTAAIVRHMLDHGDSVTLWDIDSTDNTTVAWAVASAPINGMSRVGPVYTSPEHRANGYGSAVTAAVSQHVTNAGATSVVLFTDLANPTSNSIYQKIGYRPVYDSTELEFTRLPSTT
jgi:RimJ/RimL family protein N-acetyltransferase